MINWEASYKKPLTAAGNKTPLKNIKYLLSDWDGTLVYSMEGLSKAFEKTLKQEFSIKKKGVKKYYLSMLGLPLSHQFISTIHKFTGRKITKTEKLEKLFWQNLGGLTPKPIEGAEVFLKEAKKRGYKIIVWSGTKTDILREKIGLLGFKKYIDFAIGNTPGKSTLVKGPGLWKIICKRLKLSPKDGSKKTLVLGDGTGDIEAARAIGAKVALVSKDKKLAEKADYVFQNPSGLLEVLPKKATP